MSVHSMLIIEQIKQFIAWIGGALGGLSVLFYGAGYLVHRAHINMLGMTGVLDYSHEQLLYEGAKFCFSVSTYLLKSALVIGITLLIAALVILLLRRMSWVDRAGHTVTTFFRARRDQLNQRSPALLSICVLALLSVLFVWHTDHFFYPLQDIYTGVEHVLFKSVPPNPLNNCAVARAMDATKGNDMAIAVTLWLQQGEKCQNLLLGEFRRLLAGYLLLLTALGYFAFQNRTGDRPTFHRIAIGTLTVYGVLYTLLLPMAFGVLVRSPIYPVITLNSKTGAVDTPQTLQLLSRNVGSLLVWDGVVRKATWLQADAAVEISVHGQANLFTQPPKGGNIP